MKEEIMASNRDLIHVKGFYMINFNDLSPAFQTEFHEHDEWEFFYIDGGEALCVTDEGSKLLRAGDIVFHHPNEPHNTVCNGKSIATVFNILFYCDSPAIEHFRGKTLRVSESVTNTLKALMNECNATYRVSDYPNSGSLREHPPLGGEQMSRLLFEELLLLLMREFAGDETKATDNRKDSSMDPIVEELCEYMKKNICGKLTLNDLSDKFHFSKSFLCDIFKKQVSCSPIEYYLTLKLTEAKRLLRESSVTVRQVSEILGFESPEYFSRYFKKRVGHSPRDFRKMLISNVETKKLKTERNYELI